MSAVASAQRARRAVPSAPAEPRGTGQKRGGDASARSALGQRQRTRAAIVPHAAVSALHMDVKHRGIEDEHTQFGEKRHAPEPPTRAALRSDAGASRPMRPVRTRAPSATPPSLRPTSAATPRSSSPGSPISGRRACTSRGRSAKATSSPEPSARTASTPARASSATGSRRDRGGADSSPRRRAPCSTGVSRRAVRRCGASTGARSPANPVGTCGARPRLP